VEDETNTVSFEDGAASNAVNPRRLPESLFKSSALAGMVNAVPPLAKTELLPPLRVTAGSSTINFAVPSGFTVTSAYRRHEV
jgi:hypothetical protein